ncbi:MAG: carboxypeptidase regulatory-like domain-containing protein, partial [Thermoanaerobaculia bacterium]
MRFRFRYAIVALGLVAAAALAQVQTGNVFGRVVDSGGEALPGVTVTLTGVGAPQVFVTDDEGRFRFLNLSPGTYAIEAQLEGLGRVTRSNIAVNVGRTTDVDISLAPQLSETITVTAATPLLDVRNAGTGATVTEIELEQVPTARDPWVILQQTPGVLIDRINVGGNESGQQSNYVGKGAGADQGTWNVDGVNITDMGATGSSPTYYDFDMFEEMQVTTGGSDPRIQTPGVQMNLVVKRGTNELTGSGRFFATDNSWQEDAVVPEEARGYLERANEIDHIDDWGLEAGGPIVRDRLWLWGSYSDQQIDLLTAAAPGVGASFDKTTLENWNAKLNAQIVANNSLTGLYTHGDKVKLGRSVGPGRPPETGWNQSGPTDLWKIEDTHIFTQSFYLTGLFSKVEGGFGLAPAGGLESDAWRGPDRSWHVSFIDFVTDRPQEQYRADASAFLDVAGASHELRFGFGYRDTPVTSATTWPGSGNWAWMIFSEGDCTSAGLDPECGWAFLQNPVAPRDYGMEYTDVYIGDTILMGDLTIQAGLRYD